MIRNRVARTITGADPLHSERWGKALHDAVLSFSDQQSLMGVAILVSGFSQLTCSLATYHWQLTFDLAWFSSITHLTTLTCLRHYFHERPALRIWRLLLMAITAILLSAALFPTGYIGDNASASFPAWCLYHTHIQVEDTHGYNGWYIGVTLAVMVISYMPRVVLLFPGAVDTMHKWFRVGPDNTFQLWLGCLEYRAVNSTYSIMRFQWASLYRLLFSLRCMLKAMLDLWSSLLFEVPLRPFITPSKTLIGELDLLASRRPYLGYDPHCIRPSGGSVSYRDSRRL